MPNKLTDAEVKKALECCGKDDCDNCPNTFGNCYSNLAGYTLDLINRQEGEIEKNENIIRVADKTIETLNAENEVLKRRNTTLEKLAEHRKKAIFERVERNLELRKELKTANAENENLKAEVERLQKSIELMKGAKCVYSYDGETLEYCTTSPCPISKTVDQIKAEAYKEFADKTNEKIEKARQKYQRLCKEQGEQEDEVMNIHFNGIIKLVNNLLNELVGDGDA